MIVLRQLLDRLCANWSSSCKSFFTLREKSVNYPVKKKLKQLLLKQRSLKYLVESFYGMILEVDWV